MRHALTPKQRSLRASIAANTRWSGEDPKPALKAVRAGWKRRLEAQVDPDLALDAAERERRVRAAMRAHMQRIALKSARARKTRKGSP